MYRDATEVVNTLAHSHDDTCFHTSEDSGSFDDMRPRDGACVRDNLHCCVSSIKYGSTK